MSRLTLDMCGGVARAEHWHGGVEDPKQDPKQSDREGNKRRPEGLAGRQAGAEAGERSTEGKRGAPQCKQLGRAREKGEG